ncbi:MAG: sulfatase [Cyclobacteriaceae bacterium]|nr:sulfatase [Cyclobacteriaceae bacterium]
MPNVIFILADDLGWPQTGAYGSDYYQTPNIDQMAKNSMRFTDAYTAAPVCSPTRASIMTGKHPARLHLTNFIPGHNRENTRLIEPKMKQFLSVEEFTIGNLFSQAGYSTAMFGKWHLSPVKFGPQSLPFYPDKQGFSEHFVIDSPGTQSNPEMDPHWSDLIGDASVEFIRKNADQPFFLFMSFSAIHSPLVERADSIARWRNKPESSKPENNPIIAAILARMDANVGKVLNALKTLKLEKNTMVIFYSDNGGLTQNAVYYLDFYPEGEDIRMASQKPLREGKGWLYEGGIRVPLIIQWPGMIEENSISHEVVSSYDFMPTFCELLNIEKPDDLDGISLMKHIKSGEPLSERSHYWHFPHYHRGKPCGAIRSGNWKLIEWFEPALANTGEPVFELYNLKEDIGESIDLSESLPETTMRLANELKSWRNELKVQHLTVNPKYLIE